MCRIFIVEDDFSLQDLYGWILKKAGHDIIGIADDGEQAVQMYQNFHDKPDIIILDHRMPNKDGLDVMIEILKDKTSPKIIFASADISIKETAINLGAFQFLSKPFQMNSLLELIKAALSQ